MLQASRTTASPYIAHSQNGADGTRRVAPGSCTAKSTMNISERSNAEVRKAAASARGPGRTIIARPSGVTVAATRPAGTFSNGESGERRWNDSTMQTTHTISTATEAMTIYH